MCYVTGSSTNSGLGNVVSLQNLDEDTDGGLIQFGADKQLGTQPGKMSENWIRIQRDFIRMGDGPDPILRMEFSSDGCAQRPEAMQRVGRKGIKSGGGNLWGVGAPGWLMWCST